MGHTHEDLGAARADLHGPVSLPTRYNLLSVPTFALRVFFPGANSCFQIAFLDFSI